MSLKEERALIKATYEARRDRIEHPDGRTDNGGRWYPSDEERCECCAYVRSPSRAYPWSYMLHCRTRVHVQQLLKKQGIIS